MARQRLTRRRALERLAEAERILAAFRSACTEDGFGAVREANNVALTRACGMYDSFAGVVDSPPRTN